MRGSKCIRVEEKREQYLPDELVDDILSRLSAMDVLSCRCVSRRWRNLTSDRNPNFVDLHRVPVILATEYRSIGIVDPFLLDKWWENRLNRSEIQGFGTKYRILFSHSANIEGVACPQRQRCRFVRKFLMEFSLNGLIVSQQLFPDNECSRNFVIFNPINGENVKINLSREMPWSYLHGVFFHPWLKEYCTLWGISLKKLTSEDEHVEYRVLNLGSKPCWQEIRNPWNTNPRIRCIDPVFIDKYLFWAVDARPNGKYHDCFLKDVDIMEFDIINQELRMMPCPVPALINCIRGTYCNINLVNIESRLSLVQSITCGYSVHDINIWTLKDRVQQSWDCSNYRINHPINLHLEDGFLKGICAANGELAIQSGMRLLIYNLKRGTIRIMGEEKRNNGIQIFSHSMSFASLKNCKSNIYMDGKGEVDKEEKNSFVFITKKESDPPEIRRS